MKIKILSLLVVTMGAANATVTIALSNTTNVLTNLTVDGSANTQRLIWGIIVDGGGNGYLGGTYIPGSLQTKTGAQILSTSLGTTDDILYLATAVFSVSGTGDSSTGLARPLSLTGVALGGGVDVGDNFAIVWFDLDSVDLGATTLSGTANTNAPNFTSGLKYGMLTTSSPTAHTIPTDGQTRDLTANFAGVDPTRAASFALVPEPSAALLGALGALGLLRRRRI